MDGAMSWLLTIDFGDKSKPRPTEFPFLYYNGYRLGNNE